MYYHYGKRAFDVAGALFPLACLTPVLLAAMVAVWLRTGAPVFWCHRRSGLGGWYPVVPYRFAIVVPVITGGALKTRAVRLNRPVVLVRPGAA
jgi:hypothetical protein